MPAIPLQWMDSGWQREPWHWAAYVYTLLAPRVHVKGRMALVLLAAVLSAFLWLLWRAYTVIQTPNEILVDKLGLDIPPEQTVALEEISSRQIQLSWKPSEASATSIHENLIEINGILAGTTKKHENAAIISNLTPGTLYDIRVFSVSPGRFQTPSSFLHVRTTYVSSDSSQDGYSDGPPIIRALAPRVPPVPNISPAPAMVREHSGGQPFSRRSTGARRASPAGNIDIGDDARNADGEPNENLAELSQQFQRVTQETESIEVQIQDEIREFEAAAREREAKLDAVKQEMKERDEASSDLRKQVHRAEAANRSLQSEKSKKEKQLRDKENSRRKRRDEMMKWEDQAQSMAEEIEGINKQKEAIKRRTESEAREVRDKNTEEQRELQQLEEENKEKALQLKELQEERKRNAVDEETEESREADRKDQERDLQFRRRLGELQQSYNMVWHEMQQAYQENIIARQRLAALETARRATAVSFAPSVPLDMEAMRREKTIRRPRHTNSQSSNVSSPRTVFAPDLYTAPGPPVTVPSNQPRAAFFNRVNGMSIPLEHPFPIEDDEDDQFSVAPMSPRADALLPHDLLGDESADEMSMDEEDKPKKSTKAESFTTPFPSIGPPSIRAAHGDDSPDSASLRAESSPRSFASPRGGSFKDFDSDRRSIRSGLQPSEEIPPPESGHKRLTSMSNLFSFNRQRGKTLADQLPALGSLKPGQSQSFPRKMDDFDPAQPRRRLSYGGNWAFPGSNLLNKNGDRDEDGKASSSKRPFPGLLGGIGKSSAASKTYDPFAPRTNSFDPASMRAGNSSPRPGSLYSFDKMPRPSMDDAFRVWAYDRLGARNSPLAPDWASTYSRSHSRRPSIGYGSTSNLSLNPQNADDGEVIEPRRDLRPLQAPIGTRPASSQRPSTPKLNPNAPSFTMFGFGKNKDKSKEKSKTKDKESKSLDLAEGASPPEPRKSRDGHSIAATASTMESRDSLERTASGLSGAQSLESTPASRPTFISKITRKASSNKFGSWKDKSSNLFSRKEATTPTGDTEDEHGSFEHLGRSLESSSSTPGPEDKKSSRSSLGNWSFMRKKPKNQKEDLTASEISESSEMASDHGEDHDDDSVR